MKKFLNLKTYFRNLPLVRKFTSIISIVLFICSLGSLTGLHLIYDAQHKLLYQSMKSSMSHSASLISKSLDSIESMTTVFLGDSTVQRELSIAIAPDSRTEERSEAFRSLTYLVGNYYDNYKHLGITYIDLYNTNYSVFSNYAKSKSLPSEFRGTLLETAHAKSGYAIWNTEYCSKYGLFLSRDIRRVEDLQLDTLGTIIVNIDLNRVINSTTDGYWIKDTPLYLVYDEENELTRSSSLIGQEPSEIVKQATETYGVIKINDNYYFYSKETIPHYGWQFVCFVPYNSVIYTQYSYLFFCIGLIMVLFFLSLIFTRKYFRSITLHFSNLLKKMKYFGKDNTELIVLDYNYENRLDEIGELHRRFDQMAIQVQELIQKNYISEILAKEAQLKSLETQMNPHFLYNTLESINWRAKALGANDISVMVESLGALLRSSLSRIDLSESTLKTELDIVEDYMTIIKIRFSDKIIYSVNIPEYLYEYKIPKLSLQPLVENAINYAMEEITDVCHIQISALVQEEYIIISISNNGSQFPENLLERLINKEITPHGFGIGILNIHKRMQLLFGSDYGVSLKNDELQDLATVELKIPQKRKNLES